MSRRSLARRLRLALALAAVTPAVAAAQFSSLTVFGDSFSDTGNADLLSLLTGFPDVTPSPPYAPGRVSNGPVWVEYLAASLGRPQDAAPAFAPAPFRGRNYAIASARTGLTGADGLPVGMLTQLALSNGISPTPLVPAPPPLPIDPTGLYVLFGGLNDVRDISLLPAVQREAAVQAAVENVAFLAAQLASRGAGAFLVPLLPNVGLAPESLADPALSAARGALSARFNELLAARLGILGSAFPRATFFDLRLDALFDAIRADVMQGGPQYGLTNATTPCFAVGAQPACPGFVFADVLHPTTAVHAIVARAAFERVVGGAVTPVPEPSTVALVAGGVVLLAAVTRRRRAA